MNENAVKLAIAGALFATWVGLIVAKVQGADEIIVAIKSVLGALSVHYLTTYAPSPTTTAKPADPPAS